MEFFNEKSKTNKIVSNVLGIIGLVAAVCVMLSIYNVIAGRLVFLWIWIVGFGGYLVIKGLSDIIYKKRKDGLMYLIIPAILLIGVIWYTLRS